MSANNVFNRKRLQLLFKQHLIHNGKLLIYSAIGFCGIAFLVLTFGQLGNEGIPFDVVNFLQFLTFFGILFGILYTGYSFPAFRNKETTISYLTVPASGFEKFLFEFISRIIFVLIAVPFLFWLTFNLQGYLFELISGIDFNPVGISDFRVMDVSLEDIPPMAPVLIGTAGFLIFVLPFTGAAMFSKQPLVKTLFSVALIIFSFVGFVYIVIEPLGLGEYDVDGADLWLFPGSEENALWFGFTIALLANLTMLTVAFLKLKEREV